MEKKYKYLIAVASFMFGAFIIGMSARTSEYDVTATNQGNRVGAVCMDGWRSSSTGSGTCSWHGGVEYWIYSGSRTSTHTEKTEPSYVGIFFGSLISVGSIVYGIYLYKN